MLTFASYFMVLDLRLSFKGLLVRVDPFLDLMS